MCALPDSLSDALDAKFKLVKEATGSEFLMKVLCGPDEDTFLRGLSTLETLIAIITEERLPNDQLLIIHFLFILSFGHLKPLREMGQVLLSVFQRYWAPGDLAVKYFSSCLDDPEASPYWGVMRKANWTSHMDDLDKKLQSMTSNVVSSLRKLL
jgi:hypothetical protein